MAKTLKEIYGPFDAFDSMDTTLVNRCRQLWDKPLNGLNKGELRLLIGQGIGLRELIPIALTILEDNPLIECELYRGDLLSAVFGVEKIFWKENQDLNTRVVELKFEVESLIETLNTEIVPLMKELNF